MRNAVAYLLLGLAALGVIVGMTGDITDAFRGEPAPIGERLQTTLDRAVGRRSSVYPGALLYVESDQTGVWIGASGLADIETGELMATNSRFCIGSIAKTFVATVILQLMEENAIDLDAPIDTYLRDGSSITIPSSDRITVRMLLNHTSGLPEWLTDDVIARITEDPSTIWGSEELLRIATDQEPYFEPGEGFAYSNTDYTVLGIIIENITGNWWGDEVVARILVPLGMVNTIVRAPGDTLPVQGLARGYAKLGWNLVDMTSADPSMAGAAGGNAMVSSTSDLALFLNQLLEGGLFSSTSTLAEMFEFVDAPDEQGVPYWYGLGLERYDIEGVTFIGHGGGAVGYSSVMYVVPDAGITLVASNNTDDLGTAYLELMIPAFRELGL